MDSIMVFEGDFTNPENKAEMVDVVLGLYAMVLQSQDGMVSPPAAHRPPHSCNDGAFEQFI